MSFTDLNLNEKILRSIKDMGYVTPTPVQIEAIPKIMGKHDLMVSAQTGTGKTAAFILPILNMILETPKAKTYMSSEELKAKSADSSDESKAKTEKPKIKKGSKPRVLVLVPTRELAQQITTEVGNYCKKHIPEIIAVGVFGGVPFHIQLKDLARNFKILVATPGRLLDLMERGRVNLSETEVLIVDEADRMLDMGFVDDVKRIASACPEDRQTLMFSATLDKNVLSLSRELLKDALQIKVNSESTTADNIEQRLYYVDGLDHKVQLLQHLLTEVEAGQVIIFTATKTLADELAENLVEGGLNAAALHGDMSQRQRTRTFERLKAGKIKILVATDVAARGIDIVKLAYVVNFDIPRQAEDYVHRIGRTGRAGESGVALTFATAKDKFLVDGIERLTKQTMTCHFVPGMEPKRLPTSSRSSRGDGERSGRRSSGPGRSFGSRDGERSRRPFGRSSGDSPRRSFRSSEDGDSPRRSFKSAEDGDSPRRSFRSAEDSDSPRRSFRQDDDRPRRPFTRSLDGDSPRRSFRADGDAPRRSFRKTEDGDSPKSFGDKDGAPRSSFGGRGRFSDKPRFGGDRDSRPRTFGKDGPRKRFSDGNRKTILNTID